MNTEKLPTEFKEKWIAALVSGEYEQGKEHLCVNDKYCCLGIACVVSGAKMTVDLGEWGTIPSLRQTENVPRQLIVNEDLIRTLYEMNDSGITFPEIANWINENL